MDRDERQFVMQQALERARHDLVFLTGLQHVDTAAPNEPFDVDEAMTLRWIDAALDGLDPLTIDPKAEPPR